MKVIFSLIITLVILLGGVFVADKMGLISVLDMFGLNDELKIDQTENVVTEIKNISKFTTANYYEELTLTKKKANSIVDTKTTSKIFSFIGINVKKMVQDEICIIVNGKVRAGYDMSALTDDAISISNDTLSVKLPEIQIFDAIINPTDVDIFVEDGQWSHDEVTSIKQEARERIIADAEKAGIMKKAEESGKKQLTNMFKSFGFKEVILQ